AVEVLDAQEREVGGLFPQRDLGVGARGVAAVGPASVNRGLFPTPDLQEVDQAVAVEVAGELGQVADVEVGDVEGELAGDVESRHVAESPVLLLAGDVEVEADADALGGQHANGLKQREVERDRREVELPVAIQIPQAARKLDVAATAL